MDCPVWPRPEKPADNVYTAYNQYSPVVSTLDGAGFVVAWTSQAQDDSVSGVFAQRYDAAGNKLYH